MDINSFIVTLREFLENNKDVEWIDFVRRQTAEEFDGDEEERNMPMYWQRKTLSIENFIKLFKKSLSD